MSQARKDGNFYINNLNLAAKKNMPSTALSGGMKRKLHLAMALTGPSKVRVDMRLGFKRTKVLNGKKTYARIIFIKFIKNNTLLDRFFFTI